MSYTPNNVAVFTAAFTGALAGMAVHNRSNTATSATSPQYVVPENAAGAWAEEFDTAWGATSADTLQLGLIEDGAYAVWANRFPKSTDPSFYATEVNTLIALIIAGENFFAANGIIPPTPGGGAVTLAVAAGHSVVAGHVGMLTPNETVQTATAALLGAPYVGANVAFNSFCIFVTSGTAPARVEIITEGPVDPALVNVGPGLATAVAFNSSGVPVRANDTTSVSGLHFIGWCNTEGTITLENVRRDFVNVLDFGLDSSGQNACDTACTALISWLFDNPFQTVYFPEGDYLFNSTMGPFPYGTIIKGAGKDDVNEGGGSRAAGKSGTRILSMAAGTNVAISVGHIYMSPSNARSGTVLRDMTVLGRLNNGANRAQPACITGATNTAPIKITTNSPHGYVTGDTVLVRGVAGNVAANSPGFTGWTITRIDANNFTLNGSDGTASGAYTTSSYNVSAAADATRGGQTALQVTTSTAYTTIPVGGRVLISGVTGNTNANGEFHIEPVAKAGSALVAFCLMKSSDGVSNSSYVVSNGVYAGGGTVVYGGHTVKTSGIQEIGVEMGSDGDLYLKNVRIGGFKYQMSMDGCENCRADDMDFEGISFDIAGQGYQDEGLELGLDSSCCVRVGDVKFGLGGSTNGNNVSCTNINENRYAALVFDPIGFWMSGGGTEVQGGIAIMVEPNNCEFKNFTCEAARTANFLCIGFSGSACQGVALRNLFPSQTCPLWWNYGRSYAGQSSSVTGLVIDQVYCNGMNSIFTPITGAGFASDVSETTPGLSRASTGTFAGALGDEESGGIGNTAKGWPINSVLAPQASLSMRGGGPVDAARWGIGNGFMFLALGVSDNYPFNANQSTVCRSIRHISYSPNTGYQSGGRIEGDGWANIGANAAAANYCGVVIPYANSDANATGFVVAAFTVRMTVTAKWTSDDTKVARWEIVQSASMGGGIVTMLGTPTTVYSEDLAGAYVAPTIVADNSASPGSVAAHITGYAAQATEWSVTWDISGVGS